MRSCFFSLFLYLFVCFTYFPIVPWLTTVIDLYNIVFIYIIIFYMWLVSQSCCAGFCNTTQTLCNQRTILVDACSNVRTRSVEDSCWLRLNCSTINESHLQPLCHTKRTLSPIFRDPDEPKYWSSHFHWWNWLSIMIYISDFIFLTLTNFACLPNC